MLALLESYDQNDIAGVQSRLATYGAKAPVAMMGELLAESVLWVQQLGTEAS